MEERLHVHEVLIIPHWKEWLICWRTGLLRAGISTCWEMGQQEPKADVKSDTWDEKQQEPVQAASWLLRKQIYRKGYGWPHGHNLNLGQHCALQQQNLTTFQVALAGASPAGWGTWTFHFSKAVSGVALSFLFPRTRDRHWHMSASAGEGQDDWGLGHLI